MDNSAKKRLVIVSIAYWFLLVYIIAALVWWFIALDNQNRQMTNYKLNELILDDPSYSTKYERIQEEKKRKTAQYIGEGSTFLVLTLLGAVFVYQAIRRQIKLQQQQQNFMMAVTHELKTPIAVARLNLETLLKHPLEEAKRQKLVQRTLEETERLNILTNNILVSAQLEGGGYRITKEETDLGALMQTSVQEFRNRYPDRHWNTHIETGTVVTGDPILLKILVNNLIENAVKYSARDKPIQCRAVLNEEQVLLQVTDQGPGITDSEKKKVFEKFYRIGDENTRTAKGTGLGLYLCKKIVHDHKGIIRITDNDPSGCIFTVSLPYKKQA